MKCRSLSISILLLCITACAQEDAGQRVRIIWLGLSAGSHPAIEQRLAVRMDEMIRSIPYAEAVDALETQRLLHHFSFSKPLTLSTDFIHALNGISNDRTLVMWASVNAYSERIRRTWWLFGADAQSDMSLSFSCYSLNLREYFYLGDIRARASLFAGPVFVRPADLVVHVGPAERSQLDDQLLENVLRSTALMIQGLCRVAVNRAGGGAPVAVDNMRIEKASGASDLFDIPSMEAPSIGVPR